MKKKQKKHKNKQTTAKQDESTRGLADSHN
jgi:hypothetical protein